MSKQTPQERFAKHISKTPNCWVWVGWTDGAGKYGRFEIAKGQKVNAHRYAYELEFGPVPDGTVIHHRCNNTICVRPDHLQATTQQDNRAELMARTEYEKRIKQLEDRIEELEHALNKQQETVGSLRTRTNRLRRIHS